MVLSDIPASLVNKPGRTGATEAAGTALILIPSFTAKFLSHARHNRRTDPQELVQLLHKTGPAAT